MQTRCVLHQSFNCWLSRDMSTLRHEVIIGQFGTTVKVGLGWFWLVLVGFGWFWLVLIGLVVVHHHEKMYFYVCCGICTFVSRKLYFCIVVSPPMLKMFPSTYFTSPRFMAVLCQVEAFLDFLSSLNVASSSLPLSWILQ